MNRAPRILIFNMNRLKASKILALASGLGIEGRIVPEEEWHLPLGKLFSLPEGAYRPSYSKDEAGTLTEEMIVMADLVDPLFDTFLSALRQNSSAVSLKAVLTPINAGWSPCMLFGHIVKERMEIARQSKSVL